MTINDWAVRWGVPPECVAELLDVLQSPAMVPVQDPGPVGKSEEWSQSAIKLRASQTGLRLWRNNRGAVTTDDGRHIRYGLANDSAAMNKRIKSHDLIGITPVVITPAHIGRVLGVFTSIEAKRPGWKYRPNDEHSAAQLAWAQVVVSLGGFSMFATHPDHLNGLK